MVSSPGEFMSSSVFEASMYWLDQSGQDIMKRIHFVDEYLNKMNLNLIFNPAIT